MLAHDVIIENFTSPAARIPYAGMNDNTHDIGLVIVMKESSQNTFSHFLLPFHRVW